MAIERHTQLSSPSVVNMGSLATAYNPLLGTLLGDLATGIIALSSLGDRCEGQLF